ncbi:hypothetical protein NOC27_124 [Nitrosococcus oceani AFC27]|nr:hypothetical protein NOC27_124 [Nitrosococcus oceani AFC27]
MEKFAVLGFPCVDLKSKIRRGGGFLKGWGEGPKVVGD